MTLTTNVYALSKTDPMAVFEKCRQIVGSTHQSRMHLREDEDGEWSIGNDMDQGLRALIGAYFKPDGPLLTEEQAKEHTEWCDNDCDGSDHATPCYMRAWFDTPYGYRDDNDEGCGHLHVRLVAELGRWFDEHGIKWAWQIEYTGEIVVGYERLPELIDQSVEAVEWFENVVMPVIREEVKR